MNKRQDANHFAPFLRPVRNRDPYALGVRKPDPAPDQGQSGQSSVQVVRGLESSSHGSAAGLNFCSIALGVPSTKCKTGNTFACGLTSDITVHGRTSSPAKFLA